MTGNGAQPLAGVDNVPGDGLPFFNDKGRNNDACVSRPDSEKIPLDHLKSRVKQGEASLSQAFEIIYCFDVTPIQPSRTGILVWHSRCCSKVLYKLADCALQVGSDEGYKA